MATATLEHPNRQKKNGRRPEITTDRTVITPDIAAAWLERNTGNRKLSGRHVDKLARDMAAGRFVFTGDPIRFDDTGRLIDGQHRLQACVKSGKPFEALVLYGLEADVQTHIDSGKARSAGDILSMDGFHFSNHIATACRLLLAEKLAANLWTTPFTTSEILACAERHRALASSVRRAATPRMPAGISTGHVSAIHYIGAHLLNALTIAEEFVEVLQTGIPCYDGDAAHAYRERIIRTSNGSTALTRDAKIKLLKHAWNLFAAGQPAKILRGGDDVRIAGLKPEMI